MSEATMGTRSATKDVGPSGRTRLPAIAGITLVFYGLVLLAGAALGVRRQAGSATAPSWSVLHLVVVLSLAIGLIRGQRWAWWGALVLSVVWLLLLGPLVLALLGGPGITLLLPRVDLILVALEAAALLFLIGLLVQMRRSGSM
jgi:hypothetical protein